MIVLDKNSGTNVKKVILLFLANFLYAPHLLFYMPHHATKCRKCEILCIGETCRQLNERFEEHMKNVEHKLHEDERKKGESDIDDSQHFDSRRQSVQDMSIFELLETPIDPQERKTQAKRIILKLDTRAPKGHNKQFFLL